MRKVTTIVQFESTHEFFNDYKPHPQKADTNDGSKNRRRGRDTQEWRRFTDILYTNVVFMVNLTTPSLP